MKKIIYYSLMGFGLLLFFSCEFLEGKEETTSMQPQTLKSRPTKHTIAYVPVEKTDFILSLQADGNLKAKRTSTIKTKTSGDLVHFPIEEGNFIKKGDLVAQLEDASLQLQLEQLQNDLDEALFKKNELLILSNGEMNNDSSVSSQILKTINIKSGYNKILQSIKQTNYEISQTSIHAPFDGIVTDVKVKQHQYVNTGEEICTLIDPYSFEAEFLLLENETLKVKIGQVVKVIPIAIPSMEFQAEIVRINPVVNEQGLVKLYAKLKGKKRLQLFEGMNVRALLENKIPQQLVVPKEALVLRSGREVIFTYDENEKRAKWNYVKVVYANNIHLAISEGLELVDKVIIEGNNNLAHDSEVVVKNKEKKMDKKEQ